MLYFPVGDIGNNNITISSDYVHCTTHKYGSVKRAITRHNIYFTNCVFQVFNKTYEQFLLFQITWVKHALLLSVSM